jgi:catechol 2,3-dioxygenase-like lactoylglutathione lyase family enzyme
MTRFHVHLGVPDLATSIAFYSNLFGTPPTVTKPDYAKWMLEEPRVNFAISQRGTRAGLNHLGLQAESADELVGLRARFAAADAEGVYDEVDVRCCYAHSDKHWVRDPQGIAWEAFHSLGEVAYYDGTGSAGESACGAASTACGGEAAAAGTQCCPPATEREPAKTCCG